jgi:hypothetical protein
LKNTKQQKAKVELEQEQKEELAAMTERHKAATQALHDEQTEQGKLLKARHQRSTTKLEDDKRVHRCGKHAEYDRRYGCCNDPRKAEKDMAQGGEERYGSSPA